MTTNNKYQFYATPPEVARKALEGIDLKDIKTVLDPSCGTGAFLDQLRIYQGKYYGYEIDPERHLVAHGRDYGHGRTMTMLGYDFLDQSQGIAPIIDLVVMNPPFNKGAEHFLRAYDLMMTQPKQSTIVCLLNQETIDNPYTQQRKRLADVIKMHQGTIEEFGPCFDKVRANVACIKITVPGRSIDRDWSGIIDWDKWETLKDQDGNARTDLAPYTKGIGIAKDELLLMVEAYNAAMKTHADYVRMYEELDKFCAVCAGKQNYLQGYRSQGLNIDFHEWRLQFTKDAWLNLLSRCTRGQYMTRAVRTEITDRFENGHAGLAFTLKNIENLFLVVLNMRPKIIEDTAKQVFDFLTNHANGYGKNLRHNRTSKMDSKFIIAGAIGGYISRPSIVYEKRDNIQAIDKLLCLLSGMRYEDIDNIQDSVEKAINNGHPPRGKHEKDAIDTTFFKVLWYENGNLKFWVKKSAAPYWLEANRKAGSILGMALADGNDWRVNHKWAPND